MKRRLLIKSIAATIMASPWLSRTAHATQAGDKQSDEKMLELLFVQSAHTVELKGGVLRLGGVNPATIFFSDRPERIVGHEPTEDFVAQWGGGDNSFVDNPPNAALSILSGAKPQEIIFELMNPRMVKNDLIYDVKVLEGNADVTGEMVSLFIDPLGRPMTPMSVAGVHRRTRRRVIRAVD